TSAVALYFVFKDVSFREVLNSFRDFDYIWMLPALAVFYFGLYLRGIRWSMLFKPNYRLSTKDATGGIFIGFAFNSILPARAGEFVRSYLIGKKANSGFSIAFATVIAERLLDLVAMLLSWVLAFLWAGRELIRRDAELTISLFGAQKRTMTGEAFMEGAVGVVYLSMMLIAFIILVGIPRTRSMMLAVLHWMKFIPHIIRDKIEMIVHRFGQGLESFHSPRRVFGLLIFSLLIWLTNALSILFLSYGFDFQNTMTVAQSVALIFIVCVFISVPAAPGYWGFFEAGVIFAIIMMGIHPNDSSVRSYAILVHLTQWLPIVAIGLPWAWMSHVSMDVVEEAEERAEAEEEALEEEILENGEES
ncbi:MAG: lysylphosphatidylglycerol synthase transmembrane domain-containing protein, partial [Candidatus Sumerlaeia bacterium]